MSVHDAEPGDVYRDKRGELWRVRWVCREPTVCVERLSPDPFLEPTAQSGGVSGLLWNGFVKLEPRA